MFGHSYQDSLKALGFGLQLYDFTRCVRPNGTVYGTRGKCRKGKEQNQKKRPKEEVEAQSYEDELFSYLLKKRYGDQPDRKESALKRYQMNAKLANKLRDSDDGSTLITSDLPGVTMKKRISKFDEVSLLFSGKEVSFQVNGEFDYGQIEDRRERVKAALTVRRMFESLTQTLNPGTPLRVYAYDEDGRGDQRRKAYERLGFVTLKDGSLVANVKEGGGVERPLSYNESGTTRLWYIALFGEDLEMNFNEFDFTRCQRPDGTFYGTGGQCRKGMPVEIRRIETGLFTILNEKGQSIGRITAPGALVGGGGIRGSGVRTSYDITLTTPDGKRHTIERIPTLAAAKAKVRSLMGDSKKGGDARAIAQGGLTKKGKAARMRNLTGRLEEAEEDLESAKESLKGLKRTMSVEELKSSGRARDLATRVKNLQGEIDRMRREIQDLQKAPVIG